MAAQELLAHPVFAPLLFKILLLKEQQVLSDIVGFANMSDKGPAAIDKDHQITMAAGYQRALEEFWPSLHALAKRDIAKEQAATEKKKARQTRRSK